MKIVINTDKTGFHNAREAVHMTLAAMNEGYSEFEGIYRDRYLSFWINFNSKPEDSFITPKPFNAIKSKSVDSLDY